MKSLLDSDFKVYQTLSSNYSTILPENLLLEIIPWYLTSPYTNNNERSARFIINELLLKNYPNETSVKASFVKKELLKPSPKTISIFELPIGQSRIDLCKVSTYSTAYEIKTDLDSFKRLERQLRDYYDFFNYIYIITSEERFNQIPDYVPETCGIYTYHQKSNGRYIFNLNRRAKSNQRIDKKKQLSALPKHILATLLGLDSRLPRETLLDEALMKFNAPKADRIFKDFLLKRYSHNWNHFLSIQDQIYEIDYEWFFHNSLQPESVY